MDERHWWFASKLQETFHFGGYDNPTLLEDFLSESHVVDKINSFLAPGEPHKLFFYCDTAPQSSSLGEAPSTSRQLHIRAQLSKDVLAEGCVCLYILRRDIGGEVDVTQMERELFCGELRHSLLSSLAALLTEVYTPLLHTQRNWGECSDDSVSNFLQNFDKFSNSLLETATQAQIHHPLLRRPGYDLRYELSSGHVGGGARGISLLAEVVIECEGLVADWIGTIEGILIETTDERLEDPQGSPLAELSKWQRRGVILSSLVEQLKSKESKAVLGALVATKSKLLKKWKSSDLQITDAFNNSRDRVRYLEALAPHLEALLSTPLTPTLTALLTTIKQMDGLSRAYARSGYLGILFTKISNSLVKVCRDDLESYCTSKGKTEDQFWTLLSQAIISGSTSKDHPPLVAKLNSYLSFSTVYKELLTQLKDALLTSVPFGLSTSTGLTRHAVSHLTNGFAKKTVTKGTMSESSRTSVMSSSTSGIGLHNIETIMSDLNLFSARVVKVLDIVDTLGQFKQLNIDSRLEGLPWISGLWRLELDGGTEVSSIRDSTHSWGEVVVQDSEVGKESVASGSDVTMDYLEVLVGGGLNVGDPLPSLKEESLVLSTRSTTEGPALATMSTHSTSSTTSTTVTASTHSHKAHSDSPTDSVALMVETNIRLIQSKLELACARGVEDVFSLGKDREIFLSAYQEYSETVGNIEENLCAYLKAVFADVGSSCRALDVVSRFSPVSRRVALREAVHRCMSLAFSRYFTELEEIQAHYERNKGCPPVSRNAPPVAGAVSWARQLLRRVEEPMVAFKQEGSVLQSKESVYVSRLYNRLVTALLKYEVLWLSQWRGGVETGRAGLQSTLLAQHEDGERGVVVRVNCSQRLLQLMAESKALLGMGVAIPDSTKLLLAQGSRVKQFKQQLEHVLNDFYSIQHSLDPLIKPLLASTIDGCVRTLMPGWTTLTWSLLNIDAYLYKVNTNVSSLRELVGRVQEILSDKVYHCLEEMSTSSLFDLRLATSKSWHPDEFTNVILSSITDRSNSLLTNVLTIRTALLEIISLCTGEGEDRTLGLITTALEMSAPHQQALLSTGSSENSKKALHSTAHSGVLSGAQSTRNTSVATLGATSSHFLAQVLSKLGSVEEAVLVKFCEIVFDKVGKMVVKSHDQLCSCLWSSGDLESDTGRSRSNSNTTISKTIKAKSKNVSFNLPDSPAKGNSATELENDLINSISQTILLPDKTKSTPPLQLEVEVHFLIPRICLKPSLDEVQSHLSQVSGAIARVLHLVVWWAGPNAGRRLYEVLESNGTIRYFHESILQAMEGVSPRIEECLQSLRLYDFLWQQDMHATCKYLLTSLPQPHDCSSHIENFMVLEDKIDGLRSVFSVGHLQLSSLPVKNSLRALAVAWKIEFASFLHGQGKSSLQSLVSQREAMLHQLSCPVETLDQLKSTLELLHTITDMQNLIDELYLPVERLYTMLREYNPHLPRAEVQQVDSLRDDWRALTDLAEHVQHQLLSEQRRFFEREVDKQVKAFVVRTIQFRNSFDTEGPLVPGLVPSEAAIRLGSFLEGCEELKLQRDLLVTVQKLLDIPPTPYPELHQTEQDLSYLHALYDNYQQFIDFDKRFRQELWAEVDLDEAVKQTEGFWCAYERLPLEQQDWDAARKLKTELSQYRQILPLLIQLHSKEVKNRHWLQVMSVVNCTFQLEGSIFKMSHLLDAGLLHHLSSLQEIVSCAGSELDLEERFFSLEEEWSEASLVFLPYKSHGHALLEQEHTLSLIEQLEHAHTLLATMLLSKHISPLREEASQWAIKLGNVADILQQWMSVQELWQNLEAVFNTSSTAKDFPEEAIKFASTHKSWVKLMRAAHQTKSVLLCCTGGDSPREGQLATIARGLEDCKKSLASYLASKRLVFPRLYFVSDDSLLSLLSDPTSTSSLTTHLGCLFGAAAGILTTPTTQKGNIPAITGVESVEGERLVLSEQVPLKGGVEVWASHLLAGVQATVREQLLSVLTVQQDGFSLEECAHKHPTQVASLAIYSQWTKECEQALMQCRYDRRALPGVRGRFGNWSVGKLTTILMRNAWKSTDEPLTSAQRVKLETLTQLSLWLRDVVDDLCQRKLKDIADFEWQRYIRPYLTEDDETTPPDGEEGGVAPEETRDIVMRCLDQELPYGYEYTGCNTLPVFTPQSDNYIIALTQALSSHLSSRLVGSVGSGKVQTIKGIGQLCGRFVYTLHCSSLTTPAAIARTLEGVVQDGTWVCLADVHTLDTPSISVLSQMMLAIRTALVAKKTMCTFVGGAEISLQPRLAVFVTSTPHWKLPSSLSSHFRTFSLPRPDPTLLLKAKISTLGLRGPKPLANKLVTLQKMVTDQFSSLPTALTTHRISHILEAVQRKIVATKSQRKATPEHTNFLAVQEPSESRLQQSNLGRSPGRSPGHELLRQARAKPSPSHHNTPNAAGAVLPAAALREHSLIAQTLVAVAGPMFPEQELPVFVQMVKDVFAVSVDLGHILSHPLCLDLPPLLVHTPKTPMASRRVMCGALEMGVVSQLIREEAVKAGLVPTDSWIKKTEQLLLMSQQKHAVILAGQPGAGKSTALSTVASALSTVEEGCAVKVVRVFPGVFEGLSDLYGHVTPVGDWVDGVFTDAFRKAHKATQSVSWVCLDGPLCGEWVECLPELLGHNRTLTLGNGESLVMRGGSIKLLFETGSLDHASPACLLNCGVVYFDSCVLGWRCVFKRWCANRSSQEGDTLTKYLTQVMDPVIEFVLIKSGCSSVYSEVGLLETCLAFLSSLLDIYRETAEVFSEVHVERLLLFSVIWSYGGVLVGEKDQRRFSQLLKTLTNILPDDDSEFSVFDYYVDESGEWDVWGSRVPQEVSSHVDMLGSVFVDTADTIRTEVLLDLSLSSGRHTLLVGPHGAGKTTITKHYLQGRALLHSQSETLRQTVFNGFTDSAPLHEFMQVNFHHRQGYTFGPKHHKKLNWLIDDLHSPHTPHTHPSTAHEYLRQLSDVSGLHNLQKRNEHCTIEDLVIFACATAGNTSLDPRLTRQFSTINLPELSEEKAQNIISLQLATYLSSHVNDMEGSFSQLALVIGGVYVGVREALCVSDMPGRGHYLFSLGHLESVYQGLCVCADSNGQTDRWGIYTTPRLPPTEGVCPTSSPTDGVCLTGLLTICPTRLRYTLRHELRRALVEGLCRISDSQWLDQIIQQQCNQLLKKVRFTEGEGDIPSLPLLLSGIAPELKQDDQSTSVISPVCTLPEVSLHAVRDWTELRLSLGQFLRRYREEHGEAFSLELSTNNTRLLTTLHRAIKLPKGNCMLVGSLGLPLHALATFALYIAGYSLQTVDTSKEILFKDGLRALFRQAGLEGRPVSIILNERDMRESYVLDALNSLLATGELATLFTNDEMDGLLQALLPSIKRDFPSEETCPMQYFIARVYRNLRVVLCLPPTAPLLAHTAHDFKGIMEGSKVIWVQDWAQDFVDSSTQHLLSASSVERHTSSSLRQSLFSSLSAIHRYVMKETSQLTYTGQQPGHLQQTYLPKHQLSHFLGSATKQTISEALGKREKIESPSSLECLIEKVLQLDQEMSTSNTVEFKLPYVGPTKHTEFLECFSEIFEKKNSELISDRKNLSLALETISGTQKEVETMKSTVTELRKKHEEANYLSSNLLQELTSKSCQLEKLKALLGQGSSVLSAMQMVSEQERLLAENEDDDEELLSLFGDRRSSRYDALLQKSKEQLVQAESEELAAKQHMMKSKEKALRFQGKIDRNTIDQIKSLNSPPRLVGTIMELMFTLLQQYGEPDHQTQAGDKSDSTQSTPGQGTTTLSSKRRLPVASGSHSGAETAKMEKEQWQAVQSSIGDSQKFLDLLNRLKWQDGLSGDAVKLIESKLETSASSSGTVSSESNRRQSTSGMDLITVAMARHAAESAANMCAFAISIVSYSHSLQPYNLALDKLQQAQKKLEDLEARPESSMAHPLTHCMTSDLEDLTEEGEVEEEGLAALQEEVDSLQETFDRAVIEKHSLGLSCQQLAEKLKTANHLLESLKIREESWHRKLDSLPSIEVVVTNCILAAAFTVYFPILKTSQRHSLFSALLDICQHCGLPINDDHILTPSSYPKFLIGEAALYHFMLEELPPDLTSQQNGCFISYPRKGVWPFVLDPLNMVGAWLTKRDPAANLVKFQDADLGLVLVRSMMEGATLIVTEVECQTLVTNTRLMDALLIRKVISRATTPQKVMIGDREIECHPQFNLLLVSSDPLPSVPPAIASLTSVLVFQPEREGLAELHLDSFLSLQNPKTYHDRQQLRTEIHRQAERLLTVEAELLRLLAVGEGVEEPKVTKAILLQNKAYEDAQEGLSKAVSYYSLMSDVHLSVLRSLSSQASVVTDVVVAMGYLLPLYRTTFSSIQAVFLSFIEQAGSRIQGEDSLLKMTRAAYSYFVRGYFEKDRLLFSLFLSLEIEMNKGRGLREEVEFLISPSPGRAYNVKGLHSQGCLELGGGAPHVGFGKKPFDWMTDAQWQMFLMLASRFSWVHDMLERQGKDGKEAVWRTVAEGVAPETINLADSLGHKLVPMHQLLLMCAMRPERSTQLITSFIATVLGSGLKQRQLNFDTPPDLSRLTKGLGADTLPLLLYREEPQLLVNKLEKVARKHKVTMSVCHLHGSIGDFDSALLAMQQASSTGQWLLLHHAQSCPKLMVQLPSILHNLPSRQDWKLWLSAHEDSTTIPMTLLKSVCRVVLESPLSVRASVLHSLSSTAGELITSSSRQEWLPLLHNVALLHATVRLRQEAYQFAWTEDYHWNHSHLMDTLRFLAKEFQYTEITAPGLSGVKSISWSGLRHMILEVFYGSVITDPVDMSTFAALTDHWIHPGSSRREAGRYHISSQFFVPDTRLSVLLQLVETATPPLAFTAELCGFHYTPLIQLGWRSYLLPTLSQLTRLILNHSKPLSLLSPPQTLGRNLSITSTSMNSATLTTQSSTQYQSRNNYGVLIEKLPSFIQVPSQIAEMALTLIPRSALRQFVFCPLLLKELCLQNTVERLLEGIPQPWRKEVLSERLKKHGENTPLGLFLKIEATQMTECLTTILAGLQDLQQVLSPSSRGDRLTTSSPCLVDTALSLLTLSVPSAWLTAVGPSSPPAHWPLKEWVQDLGTRYAFMDRFLTGGLAKTPTYWLGAFFNPQALLSIIQQNVLRSVCVKGGTLEQVTFRAELTSRDKDHIRDPPPEGELFVYGVYLWGCGYEKMASLDLQDTPPKGHPPTPLPVLHVFLTTKTQPPQPEQQVNTLAIENKGPKTYHCPCFVSHATRTDTVFALTVNSSDVAPFKWTTRNLACTLRPF